jgi:hypothetical protein
LNPPAGFEPFRLLVCVIMSQHSLREKPQTTDAPRLRQTLA